MLEGLLPTIAKIAPIIATGLGSPVAAQIMEIIADELGLGSDTDHVSNLMSNSMRFVKALSDIETTHGDKINNILTNNSPK